MAVNLVAIPEAAFDPESGSFECFLVDGVLDALHHGSLAEAHPLFHRGLQLVCQTHDVSEAVGLALQSCPLVAHPDGPYDVARWWFRVGGGVGWVVVLGGWWCWVGGGVGWVVVLVG